MFRDGIAKRAAQLLTAMILSALFACAGTKINTPAVETGGTKVGGGAIEVAPEAKQPPENKQAAENKQALESKQALENKQKAVPTECRRCQSIRDRLAQNESVLSDPTTGKEWKTLILKEMHFLNQQRERCWADDCRTTVSHHTATDDAASRTFSRTSNASR